MYLFRLCFVSILHSLNLFLMVVNSCRVLPMLHTYISFSFCRRSSKVHSLPIIYCYKNTLIPLFQKLIELQHILHLNTLAFVYKDRNKLSPACFHSYFIPNSSIHLFGTRQSTRGDLSLSFKRTTTYGQQTVQHFGFKLWNALPLTYVLEDLFQYLSSAFQYLNGKLITFTLACLCHHH